MLEAHLKFIVFKIVIYTGSIECNNVQVLELLYTFEGINSEQKGNRSFNVKINVNKINKTLNIL